MRKNRPVVTSKLNDWYDWLINHVPSIIKDGASRAFKTFKDKIMGFYNRVTGYRDQHEIEVLGGPGACAPPGSWAPLQGGSSKPEPFNPIELEQAFGGAYRSYRVNRRPKMDVETLFSRIGGTLINLIAKEVKTRTSAKIQTTVWIRFTWPGATEWPLDIIDLAFNSLMASVYRGSNLKKIVNEMFTHMRFQIENPALLNSRFVFDEVLFLDVNFHPLNLTRGSSYLPLPDYIAKRKAVINPQNGDEKCFKWAIIAADKWMDIHSHPEQVMNLREFADNYDWSGSEFPVSIKDIGKFEANNNSRLRG